ncbi:MAG: DUF4139 domain-containing protein [Bacteroidales bacterium]|nr:DUF4139 domain-containing protein [Bacteroidales bacterium]
MKPLGILMICIICNNLLSQEVAEQENKTEVQEVTVFIEGAQVTRTKDVDLSRGITILKFTGLSPFIDAKSIQVKADGAVTIMAVNHQQNFLNAVEKSAELTALEKQLKNIKDEILLQNTHISIVSEELAFLQENRDIGGRDQQISVANLREISSFYNTQLTALKLREIELSNKVHELSLQQQDIENQIKTLTSKTDYPSGEILVKIDAEKPLRANISLSYLVANASWFPSYDIRAVNINEPVQVIYKANVRQDTKENWNDVKLRFSSSNPNKSGVAPELQTYYLNYNILPPVYGKNIINTVTGKVMSYAQEPLPGVYIVVQGTTIGTITDMNGNYSITVPNNAEYLSYSFVGYLSRTLPITNSVMNVFMEEEITALEEMVVTGYGVQKSSEVSNVLQGRVTGVSIADDAAVRIRGTGSLEIPAVQVERQTTVDFEIETPYTVLSDNKNYSVDMDVYDLEAIYQYYCVPKIDRDVFLIAKIVDWEKYNLLEGEANVFFEDTYVGKTLLDVRFAADTLDISLGRDKNVSVNREKVRDYTTRQLIGSKKEETRDWLISIKNNKSQKINIVLLDQVPVSTLEEIEVDVQNISGAKRDTGSGEIKWEFTLEPNVQHDFNLRYSVKYPKNRNLIIE